MSNLDSLSREELVGLVQEQSRTILEQSQAIEQQYEAISDQRQALLELRQAVDTLTERMGALEKENEDLRSRLGGGGGKMTPAWVRANRPERRKKDRKKRQKSFVRKRETPTEIVEHALDTCPDCGRKLSGGTVHNSRQVIEIPIAPVRVIEHRAIARYCGVCHKTHVPKLDPGLDPG